MNTETLRQQIRATLQAQLRADAPATRGGAMPSAPVSPAMDKAVVIPLRLGRADDAQVLAQLFQRLAASPALLQMADAGLLRFDLRVDASALRGAPSGAATPAVNSSAMAATTAIDPATCCSSCKEGKACECQGDTCELHAHKAEDVPELKGVIGEKLLKTLPPSVKTVRLHPKAVMTPLGKEALRKRGITIDRGATP